MSGCPSTSVAIYNEITIEETVLPGTGIEISVISDNQEDLNIMKIYYKRRLIKNIVDNCNHV